MSTTRRAVLRSLVSAGFLGVVATLFHGLQRLRLGWFPAGMRPYSQTVGLLRPPGALSEAAFLAACIRCYRCQDACEPGAIQFYTESDGSLLHTPYVDPARKACTLCLKCGPACPTGALEPLTRMADADMGSVELREELCLSYRAQRIRDEQALLSELGRAPTTAEAAMERRGPCGECFTYCPLRGQAIKLKPGGFLAPVVFTDHCVGCGMCEEICRVVVRGDPAIRVVRTRRPAHGEGRAA